MDRSLRRVAPLIILACAATACGFSPPTPVGPIAGVGSLEETVGSATLSVTQGASTPLSVTVTPVDGFTGLVQFAFVGAPPGISLSPASLTITGSAAQQTTLNVLASATTAPGAYQATLAAAGQITSAEAPISLTVVSGGSGAVTGTLAVAVLSPANTLLTPNVAVLNASGATVATITALNSTSETLAPGSYTVVASDVVSDGKTFTGIVMGSPAAITAGATQTVTVTYQERSMLAATPAQLTLVLGVDASASAVVSESGYSGVFTESDTCAGVATIAQSTPGTFSAAPVAVGSCVVTVSDIFSQTIAIPIAITLNTAPITLASGTVLDSLASTDVNFNQPTVFFASSGAVLPFTAAKASWTQGFTASLDATTCGSGAAAVATLDVSTGTAFHATSQNPGICRVTLSDGIGETTVLWLSVTTTSLTISNLSASVQSLVVTQTATNSATNYNVTSTTNGCSTGSSTSCTETIALPAGSDAVTIASYDGTNGGGNLLAQTSATIAITQGIANAPTQSITP